MSRDVEAVKLELSKAKAIMADWDGLLKNQFYFSVVHSLYYACFHATRSLLLTKDLVTKTHRGVFTLLSQHFVATGLFKEEKASIFKHLMDSRMDSDYDTSLMEEEQISSLTEPAEEYFQYVIRMVEDYLAQVE